MSTNTALKLASNSDEALLDDQVETLRLAIDLLGSGYDFLEAQSVATGIIGSYHPGESTKCGALLLNVHVIPHPTWMGRASSRQTKNFYCNQAS